MPNIASRTQGREFALRMLYATEINEPWQVPPGPVQEGGWWRPDDGLEPDGVATRFALRLWNGVIQFRDELDEAIQGATPNWKLERMAPVERNLLRIGVFELTRCEEIPKEVTFSELIDLAKHYGDDEAGAFVNGVLDAVDKRG